MMTLMPSICYGQRSRDSLLVNRIWSYAETYGKQIDGVEKNVYMVYTFGAKRRNALLFLVPTMHTIAKGTKQYIGESYGKLRFNNRKDFRIHRQVVCGTIPHNRNVMPALLELSNPDIYGLMLYSDKILSPFHRSNRYFYKYRVTRIGSQSHVRFRPRSSNTQLIKGNAYVDEKTGRVLKVDYEGEFDMIIFKVNVNMDQHDKPSALPANSTIDATFKFLGNNIQATLKSFYDCQTTLPDSINNIDDLELMKRLRPQALSKDKELIYAEHAKQNAEGKEDSTAHSNTKLSDAAWDFVGDNLINRLHTGDKNISLYTSPLLNPLYMGYSHNKGISYKLDAGVRYAWNSRHYLTLEPQFGYSFKADQLYYTIPLRMTYNPKRNGYTEFTFGNGNRTSHAALNEAYKKIKGDSVNIPEFKDEYLQLVNNIQIFDWMEIMTGVVYHRRWSIDHKKMKEVGMPDEYRSFAPLLTIRLKPWQKGPTLTANYERSIMAVLKSNLQYERWEFDAAYKYRNKSVRILNLRLGTGFYTQRSTKYFVDYSNFRDNNLPMGWEDDWSGQFQLVDSRWYNSSNYYIRTHVSYDSPLLMLSWLPWVGRVIETERIYLSAMSIENTRPYFEVGYGFKNRLFSSAVFGSFLNTTFQTVGFKFTFELFRRW